MVTLVVKPLQLRVFVGGTHDPYIHLCTGIGILKLFHLFVSGRGPWNLITVSKSAASYNSKVQAFKCSDNKNMHR